ncbi:MAG: cysteine desulfurase family protein [Verrucomicrobiota bacterium]|nr:cysteine desulfurase family protein [Verrucomicrobiota bacterium]
MYYFDYNATAPLHPLAAEAWQVAQMQHWHNPGGPYGAGMRVRQALESARAQLATFLEADTPESIIFTSGATEGNNALFSHVAHSSPADARVIVSAIEHPSVMEAARASFQDRMDILPVDPSGVVRLESLRSLVRKQTVLVSVMAANNETGVIQPWREMHQLCRGLAVPFHTDASQWLGKLPAAGLGWCDYVTGCGHKFGGPKGVGFIKISGNTAHVDRLPFHGFRGGPQEHGYRAGTENYPAISAMLAALDSREKWMQAGGAETQSALHDVFSLKLQAAFPSAVLHGAYAAGLWNTFSLAMPLAHNTRWVALLDKAGFAVSTGAACATGKTGPSPVLIAMGVPNECAQRTIRISAGWDATASAYESLLEALLAIHATLAADPSESSVVDI